MKNESYCQGLYIKRRTLSTRSCTLLCLIVGGENKTRLGGTMKISLNKMGGGGGGGGGLGHPLLIIKWNWGFFPQNLQFESPTIWCKRVYVLISRLWFWNVFTIVIFLNSNTLDKRYDVQENKTLDVPPQTRTDMLKKNVLDRSSTWLTSSNRSPLFLLNFYYIDIFNQKVVNQHKIIVNQEY